MTASSPALIRVLVPPLEAEPTAAGTLVIEELSGEPRSARRRALDPLIEIETFDLPALARRRGLGPFLAAARHGR